MADPKKNSLTFAPAQAAGDFLKSLYDEVVKYVSNDKKQPAVYPDYVPMFMKDALKKEKSKQAPKRKVKYNYGEVDPPSETSQSLASIGIIPEWAAPNEQRLEKYMGWEGRKMKSAEDYENTELQKFPFLQQAVEVGQEYGISPHVLSAVAKKESSWNPRAMSKDENGNPIAHGLMQFRPATFKEQFPGRGGNIYDPKNSMEAAANYLGYLNDIFPNEIYALRAYNQGQGNQQRKPAGTGPVSHFYPYQVADDMIRSGYPVENVDFIPPYKYLIPDYWGPVAEGDIRAKYPIPPPPPPKPKKQQKSKGKK